MKMAPCDLPGGLPPVFKPIDALWMAFFGILDCWARDYMYALLCTVHIRDSHKM
jgi:hypothetical protein